MVAGDLSALRFIRAPSPCHPYRRVPPSRGRKVQRHNLLFPLEGKCRAAAKGCMRLRVEMKRKGCPDRQTAARLWECHLRLLPYSTPAPLCGPLPLKGAQGSAVLCDLTISNGAGGSGTISCFPLRVAKELDS